MVKISTWLLAFVLICFVGADLAFAKGGKKGGQKKAKPSVEDLLKEFDKDKDGKLSPTEFTELLQAQVKQKANRAFKKADTDSDGVLSLEELKAALQKKGGKKEKN